MRTLVLLGVAVLAGLGVWYFGFRKEAAPEAPAPQPVKVSRYSPGFNDSMQAFMQSYYAVSEALVAWDTAAVVRSAEQARARFAAIPFNELQKDSLIHLTAVSYEPGITEALSSIGSAPQLEEKRRAFQALSGSLYDLLRSIRYDRNKIYLQECPMAFNDTETAQWLSAAATIRNPYLGTKHPRYKGGMLKCGETKDSLDYSAAP